MAEEATTSDDVRALVHGVIAAPMTYAIDGEQYVAVLAGWGGVWDLVAGTLAGKSGPVRNISRLLVFKLGAGGKLILWQGWSDPAITARASMSGAPNSSSGRVVPRPSLNVAPSSITVPA